MKNKLIIFSILGFLMIGCDTLTSLGDSCESSEDCLSGLCIELSDQSQICSESCVSDPCAAGYICDVSDDNNVCLPEGEQEGTNVESPSDCSDPSEVSPAGEEAPMAGEEAPDGVELCQEPLDPTADDDADVFSMEKTTVH